MKTSQLFFAFVIGFCFVYFTFAQVKPVALKFDEFSKSSVYASDSEMISKRLERFAMQLKKQPQMQALIIGYDRRKQYYNNEYQIGDNAILGVQRELESYGIDEKRVVRIVGGVREDESYELWLLPQNAEMPKTHPEFEQSDIIYCLGKAYFTGAYYTFDRNKPLEFSSNINPDRLPHGVNFEWEISTGRITEGQGTEKIKVDVSETTQNYLTVKLNFKGQALECNDQTTRNVTFVKFPYKLAEFSGQGEDFKIFPMELLGELSDNPQLQAKLYVYAPRENSSKTLIAGMQRAKRTMQFMRFPIEKYPFESGGYRENLTFEIWLYLKGTEPPQPTPTVDSKFINVPKQTKKSVRRK